MNIASGIITLILTAAAGFVFFFFLMLGLNGFSGRDATPAMIVYVIWAGAASVVLAAASFFLTKFLIGKSFNAVLALIISVLVGTVIGAAADFGGVIVSSIVASEVRGSHIKK